MSSQNVGLYKSPLEMKHWAKKLVQAGFSVFFLKLIHSRVLRQKDAADAYFLLDEWLHQSKNASQRGVVSTSFQFFCLIFTSQRAVAFFFDFFRRAGHNADFLSAFSFLSLGRGVSQSLQKHGIFSYFEAENPSQEGVFTLAKKIKADHPQMIFFYFRSVQARSFLVDEMKKKKIPCRDVPFYQTHVHLWKKKQWESFRRLDWMVLGSPSSVNALKKNFSLQINNEAADKVKDALSQHPLYVLFGRASEESFLDFRDYWREKTGQKLIYEVLQKPNVEELLKMMGEKN